jgi:hypothetical protein
MLSSITQGLQSAITMSEEAVAIPEAVIDLLMALQDDDPRKRQLLQVLVLPENFRLQALDKLEASMRDDPEAAHLQEALHAARNPWIAQAMAQFLRDLPHDPAL